LEKLGPVCRWTKEIRWMASTSYFTKDNGVRLPVDDRFLLPFLSPASAGTNYWDRPPSVPEELHRRFGRIFLQIHQLKEILWRSGFDLEGKSMLDIGTGNGMIPRLLLRYTKLASAVGSDRFIEGTDKTATPMYDRDTIYGQVCDLIETTCPERFDFDKYAEMTKGHQHHSLKPCPMDYDVEEGKDFSFFQVGAHDLEQINKKFDVIYAKAIDHIPNWDGIFKAIDAVASDDSIVCIKHFSFFSYLGPHRYATTNIPWGHLLLTDDEYRRFVHEFHGYREEQMIDYYFTGLAYPRTTLNGLLKIAQKHGFYTHTVVNEPLRSAAETQAMVGEVDGFWDLVRDNHPEATVDEMFSGRYHLLFRRNRFLNA
jgi:hypothetical protein